MKLGQRKSVLTKAIRSTALLGGLFLTSPALAGSITLYSDYGFSGQSVTLRRDVDNFAQYPPWNDRAVSMVVNSGTWELCKHAGYRDCKIVRGGSQVDDLGQLGFYRQLSSVRELDSFGRRDDGYARPRYGDRDNWRRDPRWRDRDWDRDWRWDGPWDRDRQPPRPRERVIWDDGGRYGDGLSACQERVYQGFVQRYGVRARANFTGHPDAGTVWWDGERFNYRCGGGRVHIWQ